ncbi:unnamed protein product [Bursaphelenchus xylophilus]|nr:unnamed protein product [Bursaphelenchus xylophilus]CAG9125850.1 unnamed protein product [Bursaphelenchus xylophilus]
MPEVKTVTATQFRMPEVQPVASATMIRHRTPSRTRAKRPRMLCVVCSDETGNFNFGAQVCRACASFYKRCIMESKRYKCLTGLYKCDIKQDRSDRTKCKACRFMKCEQAGVHVKIDEEQLKASTEKQIPKPDFLNLPLLTKLVEGLTKYHAAQHEVIKRQHPEADFSHGVFITTKKTDIFKLECAVIEDLYNVLVKYFGPFGNLPRNDQIKIMGEAYPEFRTLNECHLTSYYCPRLEDNRIVFGPGYWSDPANVDYEWYFKGFLEPDEIQIYRNLVAPFTIRLAEIVKRYKLLNTNSFDSVVLMLLVLWKHADFNGKTTKEMEQFKDKVMKEWTWSLKQRFPGRYNEKLSEIMNFYREFDKFSIENMHTITQIKILRSKRVQDEECSIEKALKDLIVAK